MCTHSLGRIHIEKRLEKIESTTGCHPLPFGHGYQVHSRAGVVVNRVVWLGLVYRDTIKSTFPDFTRNNAVQSSAFDNDKAAVVPTND